MIVPKHIIKYCNELQAKVKDNAAYFTQVDFSKLAEIQAWYSDYLDQLEPVPDKWNLSDQLIEEIIARMQ